MNDGSSPFTVACKYRDKDLVDFLIENGANVNFLTNRGVSAPHECLYSWEEIMQSSMYDESLLPFSERKSLFQFSTTIFSVVGVAHSLLAAGIDVNDQCEFFIYGEGTITSLDFSVLTGSVELVHMMLSAGAYPSQHSLPCAINTGSLEIFNCLLSASAPLSTKTVGIAIQNQNDYCLWLEVLLAQRPNIETRRVGLIIAIRIGAMSVVQGLFGDGSFDHGSLLQGCLDLPGALEECSTDGHIDILCLVLHQCLINKFSITPWLGESICPAVRDCHYDVVKILISSGADVNAEE